MARRLLLCHATGFCKDVWSPFIDELAAIAGPSLVCDAINFSGHGGRAAPDVPLTSWDPFRDDVLDRVMEAHGIDSEHRDAFIAHASSFDHDGNNYLKKQELEDAAAAWNEANAASGEDAADEEASSDDGAEAEAEVAESSESEDAGDASTKSCPICMTEVDANATECSCGFVFES